MIDSNIISSATTAGSGTIVVATTLIESLKFGATSSQPQIDIAFSNGTPFQSGSQIIIPMIMTATAKYIDDNGVVYRTQVLTENFSIGYVYTSLPTQVVVTTNSFVNTLRKTKCCKSYELLAEGSLSVVITS